MGYVMSVNDLDREYCVYCVDMHCTVVARYLSCECMYVTTGGLCEQCVGVEAPKNAPLHAKSRLRGLASFHHRALLSAAPIERRALP